MRARFRKRQALLPASRRVRLAWAVLLPLLTAGCFQALLREGPSSTLGFTCAAMDPVHADGLLVQSWTAPGLAFNATPALARLAPLLVNLTGRPPSAIQVEDRAGPAVPAGGWNRTLLAAQAQPFLRQRTVTLRILWVDSMAETATGFVAGPGTVVVAVDSVAAAAARTERPLPAVALGVLKWPSPATGYPAACSPCSRAAMPPPSRRDTAAGWILPSG